MNRTLRWALLAAFAVLALPSISQSTSVGSDAWALNALGKMKKSGLLKSYPEGLFREGHAATRLEIAVAAHAAYAKLKTASQGLGDQRTKLEDAILRSDDPKDPVFTRADMEELRAVLGHAKLAANGIRDYADSAANLARIASEFEDELSSLGVDVETMKKDMSSLAARISRLEQDEFSFDLDVEWNLVSHLGHSRGGLYGLTVDGRPTGVRPGTSILGDSNNTAGLTQDVSVGHEMAFALSGEVESIKWKATLAVGNLLGGRSLANSSPDGGLYGNQGAILYDVPFRDAHSTTAYLQNFELAFDGNVMGKSAQYRFGRVGYQGIPYLFKREDTTPYFENARWDDHLWYFDGGIIGLPFANGSRLDIFGGRQGQRNASKSGFSDGVWPMGVGEINSALGEGELPISQHLGFNYWQKPTDRFDYRLNYIFLEGDGSDVHDNGRRYDRMELFGLDANYRLPRNMKLNFGKAESTYKHGRGTAVGNDNRAYWANLGWQKGRADGNFGWREIQGNYGAPGDWGRMGPNWRPVDHRGWFKNVNYFAGANDSFKLEAYEAKGLSGGFDNFDRGDDMVGVVFDWNHKLTDRLGLNLGYERFNSDVSGDEASFEWFRIGFRHDIGSDNFFRMDYESSNYSADDNNYYTPWYGRRRSGGLVTFQLGRKY